MYCLGPKKSSELLTFFWLHKQLANLWLKMLLCSRFRYDKFIRDGQIKWQISCVLRSTRLVTLFSTSKQNCQKFRHKRKEGGSTLHTREHRRSATWFGHLWYRPYIRTLSEAEVLTIRLPIVVFIWKPKEQNFGVTHLVVRIMFRSMFCYEDCTALCQRWPNQVADFLCSLECKVGLTFLDLNTK